MTITNDEIVYETKWASVNSLFDTEAEAIADRATFIDDALTRPSVYVTASAVTLSGDDHWMCGNPKLTDSEILSGNFTGYYNVSSQYNSIASVGVEAEFLPYFIDLYESSYTAWVPEVVEVQIPIGPNTSE